MNLRSQVVWGIALKAFSIIVGFAVVAILARSLAPEEYGIYSVVLAIVTVLTIPAAFGLPNYVVREVSKAIAEGQTALTRRIVWSAVSLVMLVSVLVLSATALVTALSSNDTIYRATMWVGLWLIPVMALIPVLGAAMRGIGQVTQGLVIALVLRHLLFSGLLIGWIALSGELTAVTAMRLHVFAALLSCVVGGLSWFFARRAPSKSDGDVARVRMRDMVMSTGIMGIIAGAQTLNSNLDVIMLGALRDADLAGIYKVASTTSLLTVAGLQAINMVMMSHFSRVYHEGDRTRLQRIATRAVRAILVTAVPASLLLILLGRQIINIAFGPEYLASYAPLVILVVGQLVSAFFGSVITILNMTGHERDTLKGVLLASTINVVLNAVLIPPFGAEGAAFATAATVVSWNVFLHVLIRKRLAIHSTPF